ncbi:reverse transcriptase domain-containing protein [Tanacetum coccineum]
MTAPGHLRKKVQKGKRCSKGWKKVCSTGSETRGRVYPCTLMTQSVGHTIVAAETLKVATKVLVQEQQGLLPRDVVTREHIQEERRSCQRVKAAREAIGKTPEYVDDLPKETIDSYDDLKKTFLENYLQQKKCIKVLVKIHNIRQRDGESTEEFVAASNRERKKSFSSWKQQEANEKPKFPKKGGFDIQYKAGKLSHLIKELKQNNRKEQPKVTKKGIMVQPGKKVARARNYAKAFILNTDISFPPSGMRMKEQKAYDH